MFVNSLSFRFQTEVNSVALSEVSQCGGFRQSLRPSEKLSTNLLVLNADKGGGDKC